ncbi:type III secretion system translocon protein, YopB/IpaB/SipB family [Pseudomonas sp. LAMO17WK12:I10]|uniref:type III secretion system translocon subunit SctE n=1 Tax=unclassified Pseudomonas TaxID=196821 RepID=UPI000BC814D3|nr:MULTISPECIES: type III secretion system translocon subunit SctE [unclassified Pseudomonas]PXX53992.1 invasin B [Pseudomonas sp. LAMO17WK12:I9]SNY51905.1 type III secretion system translocon protein, YopB/IpaB/SipB family [Pseudomonas sp. LAMO17WK12:I10]
MTNISQSHAPFAIPAGPPSRDEAIGVAGRSKYADAASQAANTKVLLRAADTVLADLKTVSYTDPLHTKGAVLAERPRLEAPAPRADGGKQTEGDRFTYLMASLIGLLGDVSTEGLKNRLEILRSSAKSMADGQLARSEAYQKAVAEFKSAVGATEEIQEKLDHASAGVENAQKELAQAKERLDKATPGTSEHKQALLAHEAALAKLNTANQLLNAAKSAHQAALATASTAGQKAEALAKELTGKEPMADKIAESMKTQLNAAATMLLLMTQFAELMGDSAESRIQADQELFRSMQAVRQEHLEVKAEEYRKDVEKAEAVSKAMSCIGKILGALLTIISVVAAVFTGGASLALAAVGVALMVMDEVIKAATGVSFMQEIMKPFMDHVLGPLMKLIGKAITSALKSLGVEAKAAEMAGSIIGAVIAAVAIIVIIVVVAVVGKGAATKVAAKLGEMLGKMASKMVPDILKQVASAASKAMTQVLTKIQSSLGLNVANTNLLVTRLNIGVAVSQAAGAITQTGLGVSSGIYQGRAAEHQAEIKITTAISEAMKEYLDKAVESFDLAMKTQNDYIKQLSRIQQSADSTSMSIARNI